MVPRFNNGRPTILEERLPPMDTSHAFAVIVCIFIAAGILFGASASALHHCETKRTSNTPSCKSPTIFMLQCACMVSLTLITFAGAGALIVALR